MAIAPKNDLNDPLEMKQKEILAEIVESEHKYVEELKLIVSVCLTLKKGFYGAIRERSFTYKERTNTNFS
jgi:hypothetical protein